MPPTSTVVNLDEQQGLIGHATARDLLVASATRLPDEEVDLRAAAGRVLAQDVRAPHDLPTHANSSLDGYALRAADAAAPLPVAFRIGAGDDPPALPPGAAAGIATGGVMPDGADAVLPVERAVVEDGRVRADGPVSAGDGLRPRGADVRAGHVVLPAGIRLSPLGVAAIAGLGLPTARVTRPPRAIVLTTGDELVPPGETLRRGQIHESNSYLVAATLRAFGCEATVGGRVGDTAEETVAAFGEALSCDLVVSSGGVSMGPRDQVRPALEQLGVRQLFWRVALQPGKPVWAGTAGSGTAVVGLPGNPLSALVGLHLLVRPLVGAMLGERPERPHAAPLGDPVRRMATRARALPMRLDGGVLRSLGAELSHQLARAAEADALALVEAGEGEVPASQMLPYVPLR